MQKKLYVLDVSGFIFRAYFALPPMTSPSGEPTQALYGFIRSVFKLFKDFSPDHVVAVFDGPDNKKSRTDIYQDYKANRTQVYEDLPGQIARAKEFCTLCGIAQLEIDGVEADDTMGSVAKWAKKQAEAIYLCTSDKDLCQLVDDNVFVLNPWKDNLILDAEKVQEVYGVAPEKIIDLLAMMGDSSDNIPGLPGIGPKTATKLLNEFGSLDTLLAHPEKLKGKKREIFENEHEKARMSKQLATIHTEVDFTHSPTLFSLEEQDGAGLKQFYITMGFTTLLKELEKNLPENAKEQVEYHLVESMEGLDDLITLLQSHREIGFDTETTELNFMRAMPVGIGFAVAPGSAYYVPLNGALHPDDVLGKLKPLFEDESHAFFAHNLKYDLHVLNNVGIEVKNLGFDTILASYLLNSGSRRHSLDYLALTLYGKVKTPIKELIGSGKKEISMQDVAIEKVSNYCCEDVDYTVRLKQEFSPKLKEEELEKLFGVELALLPILKKMERAGVCVDANYLQKLSEEVSLDLQGLQETIYEMAGETFNLNSPKQLSAILFEKLELPPPKKKGAHLSTSADVLQYLAQEHPIAKEILSYRSLEKLRSTYLDALGKTINEKTGRIHPNFIQFGTATGRLACQDPNLQNIPVRGALGKRIRQAFSPSKPDWSYLSFDYSQIELRLLAHLSEDPALITAFNQGEDIHTYTASLMFNQPLEQVSSVERHQAKAINFGIIYGQGAYGLSKELDIEMSRASEFIKAYFERYPGVQSYIDSSVKFTKSHEYAQTMFGRKRKLPEINSSNQQVKRAAERLAVNTPLQGSAADLIKLAMIDIDKILEKRKLKGFLVLQIHDELIFEAPDSEISELIEVAKEALENVAQLRVPLVVDVNIGKNWGEC